MRSEAPLGSQYFFSFKAVYLDVRIKKPRESATKPAQRQSSKAVGPGALREKEAKPDQSGLAGLALLGLVSCRSSRPVRMAQPGCMETGFVLQNSIQSCDQLSKSTFSPLSLLLNLEELLFRIPYFVSSFPKRHRLRYAVTQKRRHRDGQIGLKGKAAILALPGVAVLAVSQMASCLECLKSMNWQRCASLNSGKRQAWQGETL